MAKSKSTCNLGIFYIIVGILLAPSIHAKLHQLNVRQDRRPGFVVEPFCFAGGGELTLTIKGFKVESDATIDNNIGFLVRKNDKGSYSSANVVDYAGDGCIWKTEKEGDRRYYLEQDQPDKVFSEQLIGKDEEGLYLVFFGNCDRIPVSFDLHLDMRNPGPVFVGAGEVLLPAVFGLSSFCFMAALAAWLFVCMRHRKDVHKIHWLMACLVLVKALSTAVQSVSEAYKKSTGEGFGWTTAYYVLNSLKGFMLFTVIVLVGTGWSLMKPFLSDRDKKILLVVMPMQLLTNIAVVVIDESPPGTQGWLTWRDALHLFDIVCCCAILFPIVWSIRHLREASQTDGKASRNIQKLTLFREFYIMVVSYIYFTRIVVYLMGATLPCRLTWVSVLTREAASLLFYTVTGYKFRPAGATAYIALDKDDDDDEEGGGVEMEGEQMTELQ